MPTEFSTTCRCYSLIDCGAAASFLSVNFLAILDPQCVNEHENSYYWPAFTTASGALLKTYGCFNITFKLDGLDFQHDFHILANLEEMCILGKDFQKLHNVVLDFGNNTMNILHNGIMKKLKMMDYSRGLFNIAADLSPDVAVETKHMEPTLTRLKTLLSHYKSSFVEKVSEMGCSSLVPARITTKGEPVCTRPYRCPPNLRPLLKQYLDELLEAGIIEPSTSPYASPCLLVAKKDPTKYRLCVDMRGLNKVTVKDRYPLPLIADELQNFIHSKIYSSIDLLSGYHQIEIDVRDREKTAFSTFFGHFQFTRIPMGAANAPASGRIS